MPDRAEVRKKYLKDKTIGLVEWKQKARHEDKGQNDKFLSLGK